MQDLFFFKRFVFHCVALAAVKSHSPSASASQILDPYHPDQIKKKTIFNYFWSVDLQLFLIHFFSKGGSVFSSFDLYNISSSFFVFSLSSLFLTYSWNAGVFYRTFKLMMTLPVSLSLYQCLAQGACVWRQEVTWGLTSPFLTFPSTARFYLFFIIKTITSAAATVAELRPPCYSTVPYPHCALADPRDFKVQDGNPPKNCESS